MEYNLAISDMRSGDEAEGYYILSRAEVKKSSGGRPYLNAVLSDCTGSIPAKMWDFSMALDSGDVGSVVKVRGSVTEYNGALQFTIRQYRPANERDEYDLAELVPTAPIDPAETMEWIRDMVRSIADPDYRAVCEKMLDLHADSFVSIPAAKSIHHACRSGLLMHTAAMLRVAEFLAGEYGDFIDRSLLLAGTVLHDIAKEKEFRLSGLGLVTDYSPMGDLLGHLVIGAQEVAKTAEELGVPAEKSMLLQHMILSHHGSPELGAAVTPRCAESELLSMIDRMDAHMQVYRETLRGMAPGTFSDRIFALDKRIYHHG